MPVKVYFSNQIHRFSKLHQNLQALVAHITSLFKNELPQSWTIQYLDSEGDHIIVSHEHDYKELLELESSTSNLVLKLYVVPSEGLTSSNVSISHNQSASIILEAGQEVVKAYPTLDQSGVASQKLGEKPAIADNQGHNDLPKQNIEVQPQVIPQPKNEGTRTEESVQFHKAKQLIRILVKGKHPETIKDQLEKELNSLKETLTEEEKKRLEEKKQKIEERMQNRHGHWRGHRHWHGPHHHGHHEHPHFHPHPHPHHHHHHPSMGFPGFGMFGRFRSRSPYPSEDYRVPFDLLKFMKNLKKFVKTQRKGKIGKAEHCKEKLFRMIPEEGREILEAILESLPQDLDKETLKVRFFEGIKQFVEICFPEGKDQILEKLERMREKRELKREHKRHHHRHGFGFFSRWFGPKQQTSEETKENDISEPFLKEKKERCEEKRRMFGHFWHKEKHELFEKYSRGVVRKAGILKMVFQDQEMAKLCEYVSSKPEEFSMEELVLNYRK